MDAFRLKLRERRLALGWSYRRLGAAAFCDPSYIAKIEKGTAKASPDMAEQIDRALGSGGQLLALLPEADPLPAADAQTRELKELFCGTDRTAQIVTGLRAATEALAVDYLAVQGPQLITKVKHTRTKAIGLMRRLRRPDQLRDTVALTGYLSGVLSYAALDSGSPQSAKLNTEVAWAAAEHSGSDQLKAWVRGTQSLISRFEQDYIGALAYATDGLRFRATGTAAARLLCGVGQCHANMGDAPAARRALNAAVDAHQAQHGHDEMPGLFGFSNAKLAYYSGSSLIWLNGGDDARRARHEAHTAIRLWAEAGPERSIADEALAHVYAATASLQLRDLEAAAVDLEPILSLPPEQRISWIRKRMARISGMLAKPPYAVDRLAVELQERIATYR